MWLWGTLRKRLVVCASKFQSRPVSNSSEYLEYDRFFPFCYFHIDWPFSNYFSPRSQLLGDPKYPRSFAWQENSDKIKLFQYLFSKYSQLGITKPTDRPIAIRGLIDRLEAKLGTTVNFGIFECYLHRSLLWQRSSSTRMQRIADETNLIAPSWSWMAYDGQIDYMEIDFGSVSWLQRVRLVDGLLETQVRKFQNCIIKPQNDSSGTCVMSDNTGNGDSWLKYDGDDKTDVRTLRCVIIGRKTQVSIGERHYYILVVTPSRLSETFERVGIGSISERFIQFSSAVDAQIV